mgnify:CR=1 FL=1
MALALASGRLQVSDVELRLKYAGILRKKMSGLVAARFCQIDDYVTTAMRMNSLSGIPLVAQALAASVRCGKGSRAKNP